MASLPASHSHSSLPPQPTATTTTPPPPPSHSPPSHPNYQSYPNPYRLPSRPHSLPLTTPPGTSNALTTSPNQSHLQHQQQSQLQSHTHPTDTSQRGRANGPKITFHEKILLFRICVAQSHIYGSVGVVQFWKTVAAAFTDQVGRSYSHTSARRSVDQCVALRRRALEVDPDGEGARNGPFYQALDAWIKVLDEEDCRQKDAKRVVSDRKLGSNSSPTGVTEREGTFGQVSAQQQQHQHQPRQLASPIDYRKRHFASTSPGENETFVDARDPELDTQNHNNHNDGPISVSPDDDTTLDRTYKRPRHTTLDTPNPNPNSNSSLPLPSPSYSHDLTTLTTLATTLATALEASEAAHFASPAPTASTAPLSSAPTRADIPRIEAALARTLDAQRRDVHALNVLGRLVAALRGRVGWADREVVALRGRESHARIAVGVAGGVGEAVGEGEGRDGGSSSAPD